MNRSRIDDFSTTRSSTLEVIQPAQLSSVSGGAVTQPDLTNAWRNGPNIYVPGRNGQPVQSAYE